MGIRTFFIHRQDVAYHSQPSTAAGTPSGEHDHPASFHPATIRVFVADSFVTRFLGLMGRRSQNGVIDLGHVSVHALLLTNTRQVHTHFMRFVQRTCYLDSKGTVLKVHDLKPWSFGPYIREAQSVLEFPSTSGIVLRVGDRLEPIGAERPIQE